MDINKIEYQPARVKLNPSESPSDAAIQELTAMGLIENGYCKLPISVRSIPTRKYDGKSNVDLIWNGGSDGDSNLSWFYPYNPKWGQKVQAQGRSYWFVRTDCLEPTEPPHQEQTGSVRFKKPFKEGLVLLLEESD